MIIGNWLWASARGGLTSRAEWLVELPGLDVFALTGLTGLSSGVFQGVPGSAATSVTEYGVVGDPNPIDIADDAANNSFAMEKCRYIVFRLTAFQSNAYGSASVFATNPASFQKLKVRTRLLAVRAKSSGVLLSTYRISTLSEGSILQPNTHIEKMSQALSKTTNMASSAIAIEDVDDEASVFPSMSVETFVRQQLHLKD